jgi:soluble P-type ATPase
MKIMLQIDIPGFGEIILEHAVFDYNGTLACEGEIDQKTLNLLLRLQEKLVIHILTADTFGLVEESLKHYTFNVHILKDGAEAGQKAAYVKDLDRSKVVSFGNGNNDVEMLKISRGGIAVLMEEGCSTKALESANLVVNGIRNGIELILNPLRLKAGLRF